MPLVTMKEILLPALKEKRAVGGFEFWSIESIQAIIGAAEEYNSPVILQAGPYECDHAGIDNLSTIARFMAGKSFVPVALHLDHGDTLERAKAALENGFTSVMIDASQKSFDENVKVTRQVVEMAKKTGATVEGEMGIVPGLEGGIEIDEESEIYTEPGQAAEYVRQTGVDALAIAIGSAHGFYKKPPCLNIGRLLEIRKAVGVPLVLHGGTGIDESQIRKAIENGISKINISTEFVAAFGRQYIQTQAAEGYKYNVPSLFGPSMQAGKALVREKIRMFGGYETGAHGPGAQ